MSQGAEQALAAAMTDTLATKQDVRELESRMDAKFAQADVRLSEFEKRVDSRFEHLEKHLDTRLTEQEKRTDVRFAEQSARLQGGLADLERRVTVRMLAGIAAVSALVKLL